MSRNTETLCDLTVFLTIVVLFICSGNHVDAGTHPVHSGEMPALFADNSGQTISVEDGDNIPVDGFLPMYEKTPLPEQTPVHAGHPFIVVGMTQAIMCVSRKSSGFEEQMIADSSLSADLRPILLAGAHCDDVYAIGQWTGRRYRFHIYDDLLTVFPFLKAARISHTWTNETSNGEWICGHSLEYVDDVDSPYYGKTELRIEILSSDRSYSNRYSVNPVHHPFLMLSVHPREETREKGMAVHR